MKHFEFLFIAIIFINACSSEDDDSSMNPTSSQLLAPVFSIASSTYNEPQVIEITSTEPDAIIRFAINDDISNGQVYTSPITLDMNGDYTIVAQASKEGFEDSNTSQVNIAIELPQILLEGLNFDPTGIVGNTDKRVKQVIDRDDNIFTFFYSNNRIDSVEIEEEGFFDEKIYLRYLDNQLASIRQFNIGDGFFYDSLFDITYDPEGRIKTYSYCDITVGSNTGFLPECRETFDYEVSYGEDGKIDGISQIERDTGFDDSIQITYDADGVIERIESTRKLIVINEYDANPYPFESVGLILFFGDDPDLWLLKSIPLEFRDKSDFDDFQEDVVKDVSITFNSDGLIEQYTELSSSSESNLDFTITYE